MLDLRTQSNCSSSKDETVALKLRVSHNPWITSFYLQVSAFVFESCHIQHIQRTWTMQLECSHPCKPPDTLWSEGARDQPIAGTLSYWQTLHSAQHNWLLQLQECHFSYTLHKWQAILHQAEIQSRYCKIVFKNSYYAWEKVHSFMWGCLHWKKMFPQCSHS